MAMYGGYEFTENGCEEKTYKIENIGPGKFFVYGEPKRLTRKECLEMARRMMSDD